MEAKKLNEIWNSLPKSDDPLSFDDYMEENYKADFEAYFDGYLHSNEENCAGVESIANNPEYPPDVDSAVNFCVANYFEILKARVVGLFYGFKAMQKFLKDEGIPEMDCSKGSVAQPLKKFGLIPPKEYSEQFLDTVNEYADSFWEEVESWILDEYDICPCGVKKLFYENVKEFASTMFVPGIESSIFYSLNFFSLTINTND